MGKAGQRRVFAEASRGGVGVVVERRADLDVGPIGSPLERRALTAAGFGPRRANEWIAGRMARRAVRVLRGSVTHLSRRRRRGTGAPACPLSAIEGRDSFQEALMSARTVQLERCWLMNLADDIRAELAHSRAS